MLAAALLLAFTVLYALYSLLGRAHVADGIVWLLQQMSGMDYARALSLYERMFRGYRDLLLVLLAAAVFAASLRLFLNWLTGYFVRVEKGLELLTQGTGGEISLPGELWPLERRMNEVKRAIETQKSEMQLAQRRKNDLIMYLAHDLKTPLASALAYLHLLQDEEELSPKLRDRYVAISLEKAERLESLINEFFEIAKFSLADIPLQYSQINLTRLLEQLVYESGPLLNERGLRCVLSVEPEVTLCCDADKIQRVFDNLLRNAILYSDRETEIRIAGECQEEELVLRFENHGAVIPEEKLERIFEQFYRLDGARDGGGGAGLGLAIAKRIVTLHGGTITARSEAGLTTMEVRLPRRAL